MGDGVAECFTRLALELCAFWGWRRGYPQIREQWQVIRFNRVSHTNSDRLNCWAGQAVIKRNSEDQCEGSQEPGNSSILAKHRPGW